MKPTLLFVLLTLSFIGFGQEAKKNTLAEKLQEYKIQPIVALQFWTTYTSGMEVYNTEDEIYEAVDDRVNIQLRRSRLGLKGQPYENIKFNITAALDLVGRDLLSGTDGGGNNGGSPKFRIWNAYLQWRLIAKKEGLNMVVGYFTPQIGRESITSALRVSSMEKSWSQNYLRRHLVGTGPGRALGMNIGGLLGKEKNLVSFKYDIGCFNPVFEAFGGNSTGIEASLLIVGRFLMNIGDVESKKYSIGHATNFFGKRNGLSIAISGARQGRTDLFEKNFASGIDLLYNWGHWNINGEWTYLWRTGRDEIEIPGFTVRSNTGFIRLSYNQSLKNGLILEPVFMFAQFNGEMDEERQAQARLVGADSGKDQYIDFGLNLYFNPNLKVSIHGMLRNGKLGALKDGERANQYFYQNGVGAIKRGDWVGLGLVAVL